MSIDNYKLIENYFKFNTNWDNVLNLLYKNAENSQDKYKMLWFKIKDRNIFDDLPELTPFLEKLNKDFDEKFFRECGFYDSWDNGICNCHSMWHMDGPVISLDNKMVSAHKDRRDAAYIQILGKSFWKLDGKETIVLNPNDLLFISSLTTHEVWGESPRMGILFMDLKTDNRIKPSYRKVGI